MDLLSLEASVSFIYFTQDVHYVSSSPLTDKRQEGSGFIARITVNRHPGVRKAVDASASVVSTSDAQARTKALTKPLRLYAYLTFWSQSL